MISLFLWAIMLYPLAGLGVLAWILMTLSRDEVRAVLDQQPKIEWQWLVLAAMIFWPVALYEMHSRRR